MRKNLLLFICAIIWSFTARAQCPKVYDGTGAPSGHPYWINCTGGAYNLNFSSPSALGSYTVNWGDGSGNTTGASLNANTIITHNYAQAIDTFIVTLITSSPSCTLTGVVVMEKPVNASIQVPVGGVTTVCAPHALSFINSSTDVSQTTHFTWDFGDGSPTQSYNYTNAGQTVTHTYQKHTVNCQTKVTLTASNYCTFSSPTTAQFNPIQIYDIDDAAITPDAYIKCFPDDAFTYTNTTNRNCYAQGNNGIRYEKWDLGNYFGKGHDSIIDWTAWPPTFPKMVTYPGLGNYTVMLYDSNMCGIDTVALTVSIVGKPTAGLSIHPDTVCLGTPMTFTNTSSTGYSYKWNFGDNGTYTTTNYNPQTHTYASPGNYTVSVVAQIPGAAGSCKDTARKVVTVLPAPVTNFNYAPPSGCNSIVTTFTDATTGSPVGWQWTFSNGNTFNGQSPPAQTYTFGTYTVSLKATSANGCVNTKTHTVTVYQTPVPQFTTNVGCLNNTVSFTDQSTHAAGDNITQWNWNFGDASLHAATQNTTHTYTTTGNYSVTLVVKTAHCADSIKKSLTINPLPAVSFTASPKSGCPSLPVTFTNTSTGATTYTWNFGNGITSNSVSPSETFTNGTQFSKVYTVTLVGSTAIGCRDSVKDTILVFGKPVANFVSNATPGCAPFNVTFTNTSVAATSYSWNFGDGSAMTTSVSPTHFYQNTTGFLQNYTVTLHAYNAGSCQDSVRQAIQVYPQAQFNFSALPDSGCTKLQVSFPAQSGAVSYQWNFGDGNNSSGASPVHTFTNNTNSVSIYTVQLIATNAFNCKDTVYHPIKVFPKPQSSFTTNVTSGCSPVNVSFTNNSQNYTTSNWLFGDGGTSTATAPAHTYTTASLQADSFKVKLVVYNFYGCTDTSSGYIKILPKVNASFTSDSIGCSPLKVSFINASQGATIYNWNFGDATATSSFTNPIHTYTNTNNTAVQSFTAQLVAQNSFGCSDTARKKIVVYPKPVSNFSVNINAGCSPFTPLITDLSAAGLTYNWNFGDGNTSASFTPSHTYTNNTTAIKDSFNLQLVVTNTYGCSDTLKKKIYVYPRVTAAFTSDSTGCSPLKVQFINSSTGSSMTYTWNYGDGSNTANTVNPTHTYTNVSGTINNYTTALYVKNNFGCADSAKRKITVLPKPIASFTVSASAGCTPFSPSISNTSQGATTASWNFGDGATSVFSAHTYTNTSLTQKDSFLLQLFVANSFGCKDTAKKYMVVSPATVASFFADTPICAPVNVAFHNSSQGANLTYTWNYGDGTPAGNSASPSHVYTNTTTAVIYYTVTLTATNPFGCSSTYLHTYNIYPKPVPNFSLNPSIETYPNRTVAYTNLTNNASSFTNYWTLGDGTTSNLVTPPNHTYNTWGTYSITLYVSSQFCSDSLKKTVTILPPKPVAAFKGKFKGCAPLTVKPQNTSQYATSYLWDFGDNSGKDSDPNPTHTYYVAGNYDIKLIVSGPGGKDSIVGYDSAIVYGKPTALFSADIPSGYVSVGDLVKFTNQSSGAVSYVWNFGDSTVINANPPANETHSYKKPGEYEVTLVAVSSHGCKDTFMLSPLLKVEEQTSIQVPNAFTPNGGGSSDGIYDPYAHDNDIFHPNVSGFKTYELDIFDRWGELLFVSKDTKVGWDGYYKGKMCQQGIYVWRIRGTTIDGKSIDKAGDLTLLR